MISNRVKDKEGGGRGGEGGAGETYAPPQVIYSLLFSVLLLLPIDVFRDILRADGYLYAAN